MTVEMGAGVQVNWGVVAGEFEEEFLNMGVENGMEGERTKEVVGKPDEI